MLYAANLVNGDASSGSDFLKANESIIGRPFECNVQHTEQHDFLLDDLMSIGQSGLLVVTLLVGAHDEVEIVDLAAVKRIYEITQPLIRCANQNRQYGRCNNFTKVENVVPSNGC